MGKKNAQPQNKYVDTYRILVGTEGLLLVVCADDVAVFHSVRHSARGRVKLQRRPRASLALLLVDGERLGYGRVEAKTDVSDVESLA